MLPHRCFRMSPYRRRGNWSMHGKSIGDNSGLCANMMDFASVALKVIHFLNLAKNSNKT